jgi:hypothetical protein
MVVAQQRVALKSHRRIEEQPEEGGIERFKNQL